MTVTMIEKDPKLTAKAEAERKRQERIKTAGKRLAALPKDVQTKVKGLAARAEQDGKAAGLRKASVAYLEDALATVTQAVVYARPGDEPVGKAEELTPQRKRREAKAEKAPPRPKGPREKSTPKETPGQLAPERKERPRSGPAAVQATVTVTVPATTKTCTRCHTDKPLADFLTKAGTGKPRPTCRPCYNEAWREFDQARKAKAAAAAVVS